MNESAFELIHTCKFQFRTVKQAQCLAAFAAQCFPDPKRVLPGLSALMVNAIEHGCLGIGYRHKSELIAQGAWQAEIERREAQEDNARKIVETIITRKDGGLYAIITDPGAGFEWQKYMSIDPARANDNHGRGIAQARAMSFDRLTYNEQGTQAVAYVGLQPALAW